MGKFLGVGKSKHLIGAFPVELPAQNAVHMRKNQVDSILRKVVEGCTAWDDISQKCMIVFNMRLLVGSIGITEEKRRLLKTTAVIFKSRNSAEFTAVIREKNGKDIIGDCKSPK